MDSEKISQWEDEYIPECGDDEADEDPADSARAADIAAINKMARRR